MKMKEKGMVKRHYHIKKDGWKISLNNGLIFGGCMIGNLIQGNYVAVLILAPFSFLMFILAWVAYKYGK